MRRNSRRREREQQESCRRRESLVSDCRLMRRLSDVDVNRRRRTRSGTAAPGRSPPVAVAGRLRPVPSAAAQDERRPSARAPPSVGRRPSAMRYAFSTACGTSAAVAGGTRGRASRPAGGRTASSSSPAPASSPWSICRSPTLWIGLRGVEHLQHRDQPAPLDRQVDAAARAVLVERAGAEHLRVERAADREQRVADRLGLQPPRRDVPPQAVLRVGLQSRPRSRRRPAGRRRWS